LALDDNWSWIALGALIPTALIIGVAVGWWLWNNGAGFALPSIDQRPNYQPQVNDNILPRRNTNQGYANSNPNVSVNVEVANDEVWSWVDEDGPHTFNFSRLVKEVPANNEFEGIIEP
jgi:hypothetical protein